MTGRNEWPNCVTGDDVTEVQSWQRRVESSVPGGCSGDNEQNLGKPDRITWSHLDQRVRPSVNKNGYTMIG